MQNNFETEVDMLEWMARVKDKTVEVTLTVQEVGTIGGMCVEALTSGHIAGYEEFVLIRGLLEKCEKITDPFLEMVKEEEFPEEIDG